MRPKTKQEIEIMRSGGRLLATILDKLEKEISPGISTKDLADIARTMLKKLGGQPAFLGHENFPDVMTVSINEEIVHAIPSPKKIIQEGDVVGLDFGVIYKGLYTDGARTVYVGQKPPADIYRLLDSSQKALYAGIDAIKGDGTRVGDVSSAVQAVLDKAKLGIIRDLVGHGVGDDIHESPNIPNYGVAGTGVALSAGMTICIEPMASLGDWQIKTADDKWTVVMADGSLSAHFEHTVLVTEKGAEILTTL